MEGNEQYRYQVGEWFINPSLNIISNLDSSLKIEPLAMDILMTLVSRAPMLVTTEELLQLHWSGRLADPRLVSKRINQIRKAMGDSAKDSTFVETIPKRGYRVIKAVSTIEQSDFKAQKPTDRDINKTWASAAPDIGLSAGENQSNESGTSSASGEAHKAYLRGLNQIGPQDFFHQWLPLAVEEFETAVSLDSGHCESWALLGLLNTIKGVWVTPGDFSLAEEFVQKALFVDTQNSIALTAKGYLLLLRDWDLESAEAELKRAYTINPMSPIVLIGTLRILTVLGKFDEAVTVLNQMNEVAPNHPGFAVERIKCFFELRLYEGAIAAANGVRKLFPGYSDLALALAYHKLGCFEESYLARLEFYRLQGSRCNESASRIENGWKQNGYHGVLDAVANLQYSNDQLTADIASRDLYQGRYTDSAFERLQADVLGRKPHVVGLVHNPIFDELRRFPKFDQLLGSASLEVPGQDCIGLQADVARVQVFNGCPQKAIAMLPGVIADWPKDARLSFWHETLAWAYFLVEEYEKSVHQAQLAIEKTENCHRKCFALLLQSSSYQTIGCELPARVTWAAANRLWPGVLSLRHDIGPFFVGGDSTFRDRFFAGLSSRSV